jgi:hypothetical protein
MGLPETSPDQEQERPVDPVLPESEETRIVESLTVAFPEAPPEEIRRRVEAHNRSAAVRCRRYIAPLVHSELMEWRRQTAPS